MEAVIRKWGNSPALRLPAAAMKEAGYQLEQKVELIVSRGRIVIRPSEKVEYDLDALVGGHHRRQCARRIQFRVPREGIRKPLAFRRGYFTPAGG